MLGAIPLNVGYFATYVQVHYFVTSTMSYLDSAAVWLTRRCGLTGPEGRNGRLFCRGERKLM
jgi:hypothetical protein